jgi:hypothetical protein
MAATRRTWLDGEPGIARAVVVFDPGEYGGGSRSGM